MYWRGKRSKTAEYLAYQNEIRDELMGTTWPFSDSPLHFVFDVGLSARQADLDNTFKPLFDTLQTIYEEFNDNKVYTSQPVNTSSPKGESLSDWELQKQLNRKHSSRYAKSKLNKYKNRKLKEERDWS